MISAGCIKSAPQAPRLPAFIAAIESEGADPPAIGANKTGIFNPKRRQNASLRAFSGDMVRSYQPDDPIKHQMELYAPPMYRRMMFYEAGLRLLSRPASSFVKTGRRKNRVRAKRAPGSCS
jgi:hypothetical protein